MVWPLTIKDRIDSPKIMEPIQNSDNGLSAAAGVQENIQNSSTAVEVHNSEVPNNANDCPGERTEQSEDEDELYFHDTSNIEFNER